jgi:biotin carboxyl carrier protein
MFTSSKTRFQSLLNRSPFTFFFSALALLLGMIIVAGIYRQPAKTDDSAQKEAKIVDHFVIGTDTVTTTASALVKKETFQPLVALTAGTVQNISTRPGSRVSAGTPILRLSADYGANRAGLETALAEKNQRFALDMAKLDREILTLEKKKVRKDSTVSDTETDIALKKLKRQRAALNTSLSTGALSVDISRASAAALEPRAMVSGTIERIAVQVGDFVTPGTVLALLRTDKGATILETFIDPALARSFDATTPSHVLLNTNEPSLEITPSFFSTSEIKDGLFHIRYLLSPEQSAQVSDNTRVILSLPLRAESKDAGTLIPLDALFTHTNHTSLFIEHDGKAEELTVSIQKIFGNAALLNESLPDGTSVLLNRALISGEAITLAQ